MAGTIVLTSQEEVGDVRRAIITATADAADGSFPTKTLFSLGLDDISGLVALLVTNPGVPAPTDNYDITLPDGDGLDRLGGAGANRDTATSERTTLTSCYIAQGEADRLTLTISNNSVNSAVIVITLVYLPKATGGGGTASSSAIPVAVNTWTPTTYAAGAFVALEAMHTADITLTGMARENGGTGVITRLTLLDKDDNNPGHPGVLHIFDAALANTTHTAGDAFAPTDADAAAYIGSIPFGPWHDFNVNMVSTNSFVRLHYKCAAGSTSLYAVAQTLGTPTHSASGLVFTLQAELD